MWLTWRTWTALLPKPFILEIGTVIIGLLTVALYLFSPIALALELSIRPEGIMAFTAFLQLFCIASYCRFRWHEPRAMASLIFGALALLLAYALFMLKPNWLLSVRGDHLAGFRWSFWQRPFHRPSDSSPLCSALFLIVVHADSAGQTSFHPHGETRLVLPMTLFTIHADVIQASMRHELEEPDDSEERRRFLEAFLPVLDREMETARTLASYYPRLGFDPDYLMYRSTVFPFLEKEHGNVAPGDRRVLPQQLSLRDCQRAFRLMRARSSPSSAISFFRMTAHSFARASKWESSMNMSSRPCRNHSIKAISQPVREMFDVYRRSAVVQAAQSANLEVFRSIPRVSCGASVSGILD